MTKTFVVSWIERVRTANSAIVKADSQEAAIALARDGFVDEVTASAQKEESDYWIAYEVME